MLFKLKALAIVMAAVVMLGSMDIPEEKPIVPKASIKTRINAEEDKEIGESVEFIEIHSADPILLFDGVSFIPGVTPAGELYNAGYTYVSQSYFYEKDGVRINLVTNSDQTLGSMGLADNDLCYKIGIDIEDADKLPATDVPFGYSVSELKSVYGTPIQESVYGEYNYLRYEYEGYSIDLKIHNRKGLIQITVDALPVIYG